MKKEFYIGQPLIVKETGEKVTFAYDDGDPKFLPCNVFKKSDNGYYECEDLEPSTEFKFSELIAGLEQRYFEVGTKFRLSSADRVITVNQGINGLYLDGVSRGTFLISKEINSTWTIVEPHKEMTLEEIEAELGYKIKLKN